jgi:molybdenum cofactor biosynthesis protein MoaC
MKNITDFFKNSQYHMADITRKTPSFRRAVTMGRIYVGQVGFTHIKNGTLPKGDVLKLAEIAGVQGAKNAWQQIPMCHPLLLDHVAVYLELEEDKHAVLAYAIVSTTAKTGVEMEALAAVSAALLTLYDLTKPVEPALCISDTRLLIKEGGKKGLWVHPDGIPDALQTLLPTRSERPLENVRAAVITLSDRAHKGEYEDKSGVVLQELLAHMGCDIVDYAVLPDESEQLEQKLAALAGKVALVITTGGTGLSPRDITPQTISKLANVEIAGIGELLRASAAPHVPTSWLSRSLAVIIDDTLVVSLPGSTGGVKDGIAALKPILSHALDHVQGKKNIHNHPSKQEK